MLFVLLLVFFVLHSSHCQTIKQLNEIIIKEELTIGSIVTFLTDKIPNLEQSVEYDLVTPLSSELDLFSIDHTRHTLNIKKRLDYEQICSKISSCTLSISIAVSNLDTIDVYILPIQLENIDDNPLKFLVNRTVIEIEENDQLYSTKTYPLPSAIDADGDVITYALYGQNWTQLHGLFELDAENFLLKPLKSFDREEQQLYSLRLVARNQHQKEISTDILIVIKDQNDNSPQCPSTNPILFSIDTLDSILFFNINVTDVDEGENARLEYQIIHPIPGFTIARDRGEMIFNPSKWIRGNSSKLSIQITDHGQPTRLSTECFIEFQFTSLLDIHLQFQSLINIDTLDSSIGQLKMLDKQTQRTCTHCSIRFHSSWNDLFIFNETTQEFLLNSQSRILLRILSNHTNVEENLSVMMKIDVWDVMTPAISSTRNYSLMLRFNKARFFHKTNRVFLRISEDLLLNESIALPIETHPCFDNQSNDWQLFDTSNTFHFNEQFHLMIKKSLNIRQQQNYQIFLRKNHTARCSIELHLFVFQVYSLDNVQPYFPQPFYILSHENLSSFILPTIPSHVKYLSSNPHEISIEHVNHSITIQSSILYSTYAYDFQIYAIDSQTPSLSCSIPIRIFFGRNEQSARLMHNDTQRSLDISTTDFTYRINAYDPELGTENLRSAPVIEYEIDPSDDLDIDRYTGRIYFKNVNRLKYDFVVTMMDFGQPSRLITRQRFTFDMKLNSSFHRQEISMFISRTLMLIIAGIIFILISIVLLIILFNTCRSRTSSSKKSLANLSPTTPDCRLIDNEYITTTTSLPRVIIREQRIYPTASNEHLASSPSVYTSEKTTTTMKKDYQQNLSINDINKYLERFEKIYNNSSNSHLRENAGSVV